MNKKGKHKKGKVPNPSPFQEEKGGDTVEELSKSGDKCEDLGVIGDKKKEVGIIGEIIQSLEEKVESVKEERVPEIVSDIITPSVDIKDEKTPKKPKRNRGKKKNGKDEDFDDNLDEKPKETDMPQSLEETKVDILEVENQPDDLPLITPTARKKKNKKKNTDQKFEEPTIPDQEPQNVPAETLRKEPEEQDIKTDISEQEVKPSKKKKNKKKRNDSERSDKEEFSCTAAFQKILDDKDEPVDIKAEEKVEDNIVALECIKADKAKINLEHDKENLPIQPVFEMTQTPIKDEQESKETPITEGKKGKKNKKDRKHITKPEEDLKLDKPKLEQSPMLIMDIDTPVQNIIPEQVKEVTTSIQEEVSEEIASIESPKPKAKIAKPVEKKRKGKHEGQTFESTQQDINIFEPIKVEEELFQIKLESQSKENVSEVESKITQPELFSDITFLAGDTPDEDEKLFAQEFELIAEKAMGKKRKKSAKMPKTLEIGSEIQEQTLGTTDTDTNPTVIKEDIKTEQLPVITEILTPQIDQQEFLIMCEKSDIPTKVDTVTESKDTNKPIEITQFQGKELLTPDNIVEEREFTTAKETTVLQTEDKQKTEPKPGKKRKKSPKPPKKTEVVQIEERAITPKSEEITKETSKSEEITKQSLSEKITDSNITRMYDIEISSIKADESEGSACDVTPDITYPRAASQRLPDDNNNTVIREIFPLVEPTEDTFLTSRCIETPKKEVIAITLKEEKTDLKSKMIEVNQDMEELRLSIERSLAELTSIEKSEEAIEKEFEVTRTKAEKVSNILFDTEESVEIQKSTVKEKNIDSDILETAINKPLHDTETTKVIEGNNNLKIEEKTKALKTKKGKQISDLNKKAPTEEKNTESPIVESKIMDAPFIIDTKTIEPSPKIDNKPFVIPPADIILSDKPLIEEQKVVESPIPPTHLPLAEENKSELLEVEKKDFEKPKEQVIETPIDVPPVCPARKDNKGKNKKKKGKQETQMASTTQTTPTTTQSQSTQESKKEEKKETKSNSKDKSESKKKGKQQSSNVDSLNQGESFSDVDYEPIEKFEDALTSSADDVNKTFEMIVKESQEQNNPKINVIAPDDEKTKVSPPKNLLGRPDIPVRSNRRDYKKEKDKIPNEITARVRIKDSVEVEKKPSKNTQTTNKMKDFTKDYKINDNEDFVYKYSFRKVFLQSACHVCKKNLSGCRVPCSFCNLLFYCSNKHKDEDWPHHQALCFAVSTLGHLKDQKHIYADAKNLTGHDYRLIRMQMIVSCEKVLKRRLVPWEQECLLYPRVCAHVPCREWRQGKLSDCQGCGQISFCTDNADHFPKSHSHWCKSYSLYEKLVCYQQTKGRLEPKMPTKVLQELQPLPEKINEVLASMYEEKIDISDIQYAALTQLATAPLTAAYCHQLCRNKVGAPANGVLNKKSSFTIHVVGAELQFEADALNKWEVFFLHLRPDLQELRVVLINYNLNPSNLPLELLEKIKFCDNCRQNKRRVVFDFQDKRTYTDYKSSEDFVYPDIVCAFNPSIQRSSVYNGKDPWPTTINIILKLKIPFIITAYTITELHKDCIRIKECSETGYNFIAEPKYNHFASVRPDRNFISDDEIPLLFKNYCFAIISG